jgi:putative redox protein
MAVVKDYCYGCDRFEQVDGRIAMSDIVKVQVNQIGPSTSEGTARDHRVLVDRPVAKGGEDQGAMGGELLLVAVGGCFMSNLLAAIRARDAAVSTIRIEVIGTLGTTPGRFTAIELKISADYSDRDLITRLVTIAERGCLVANTLREPVDLSFSIG